MLASNSLRPAYLCLPSAGIKSVYSQPASYSFWVRTQKGRQTHQNLTVASKDRATGLGSWEGKAHPNIILKSYDPPSLAQRKVGPPSQGVVSWPSDRPIQLWLTLKEGDNGMSPHRRRSHFGLEGKSFPLKGLQYYSNIRIPKDQSRNRTDPEHDGVYFLDYNGYLSDLIMVKDPLTKHIWAMNQTQLKGLLFLQTSSESSSANVNKSPRNAQACCFSNSDGHREQIGGVHAGEQQSVTIAQAEGAGCRWCWQLLIFI